MKVDIKSRLKSQLQSEALELLEKLSLIADDHNQRLYLVGGIVRDLFLGRGNLDFDLVLEGNAIELANNLVGDNRLRIIKYDRFRTATIIYGDLNIDLISARQEFYAHPGALPEVIPGNIENDLFRRDFTINAMAIALNRDHYGKFIDPYNGARDIKSKLIRIIHPLSFIDDATRIFRALRYEQRLGFKLERSTQKLLKQNLKMINTISPDRIKNEINLIFKEERPELIISRAQELGILQQIHPTLKADKSTAKYYKQARLLVKEADLLQVYLNLLILPFNREELKELCQRLNPNKKELADLEQAVTLRSKISCLMSKIIRPSKVYELLKPFKETVVITNMIASDSENIKRNLKYYLTDLICTKPLLTGRRLKEMGIPEGPQIGLIMERLLSAKLDGKANDINEEIKFVQKFIKIRGSRSRKQRVS